MSEAANPAVLARQRLSYVTPDNAGKVIRHERYWTKEFLELYLRRCEEERLADPVGTLALLRPVPELIDRVCARPQAAEPSWRVEAMALEGETAAWAGWMRRSGSLLRQAWAILRKSRVRQRAAAALFLRQGAVARLRGSSDAPELLSRAIELGRTLDSPLYRAEALWLRASLNGPEALVDSAKVLALAEPSESPRRKLERDLFEAALYSAQRQVSAAVLPLEGWESVLRSIKSARSTWFARKTGDVLKVQLLRLESRALERLGLSRPAIRRSRAALTLAERLGLRVWVRLVGLDLACLLRLDGERDEAGRVIEGLPGVEASRPQGRFDPRGLLADWERARDAVDSARPPVGYAEYLAEFLREEQDDGPTEVGALQSELDEQKAALHHLRLLIEHSKSRI